MTPSEPYQITTSTLIIYSYWKGNDNSICNINLARQCLQKSRRRQRALAEREKSFSEMNFTIGTSFHSQSQQRSIKEHAC